MCYTEPARPVYYFESWTRARAEQKHVKNVLPGTDAEPKAGPEPGRDPTGPDRHIFHSY